MKSIDYMAEWGFDEQGWDNYLWLNMCAHLSKEVFDALVPPDDRDMDACEIRDMVARFHRGELHMFSMEEIEALRNGKDSSHATTGHFPPPADWSREEALAAVIGNADEWTCWVLEELTGSGIRHGRIVTKDGYAHLQVFVNPVVARIHADNKGMRISSPMTFKEAMVFAAQVSDQGAVAFYATPDPDRQPICVMADKPK